MTETTARPPGSDYWRIDRIEGALVERTVGRCHASPAQKAIGAELLDALNKAIPHGGRWAVGWTGVVHDTDENGLVILTIMRPTILCFLWIDPDGDVPFTVTVDDPIHTIALSGPTHWIGQCEDAWTEWNRHMRDVDVQPHQTIKFDQGERPRDPAQQPDI